MTRVSRSARERASDISSTTDGLSGNWEVVAMVIHGLGKTGVDSGGPLIRRCRRKMSRSFDWMRIWWPRRTVGSSPDAIQRRMVLMLTCRRSATSGMVSRAGGAGRGLAHSGVEGCVASPEAHRYSRATMRPSRRASACKRSTTALRRS